MRFTYKIQSIFPQSYTCDRGSMQPIRDKIAGWFESETVFHSNELETKFFGLHCAISLTIIDNWTGRNTTQNTVFGFRDNGKLWEAKTETKTIKGAVKDNRFEFNELSYSCEKHLILAIQVVLRETCLPTKTNSIGTIL